MPKPDLKVVQFPQSPTKDVPASLRKLADDIESGRYGPVDNCGMVFMGNHLNVFGFGDIDGADAHMMFCAASRLLENQVIAFELPPP